MGYTGIGRDDIEHTGNVGTKAPVPVKDNQFTRKDFVDRSRKLFKSIERQHGKRVKEFQRLGRKSGIDPSVFIRDVGLVTQTQPGTKQVSGQTKSGNTFRRK